MVKLVEFVEFRYPVMQFLILIFLFNLSVEDHRPAPVLICNSDNTGHKRSQLYIYTKHDSFPFVLFCEWGRRESLKKAILSS